MTAVAPVTSPPGSEAWEVVERILTARRPLAIAVTGGGSRAVSWLLNHPGASRAIVDVRIPYHAAAIDDYLERPGPHRVAEDTARRLAARARLRACQLAGDDSAVGLGATAALATDRVRRGVDRAFAACRGPAAFHFAQIYFEKAVASRLQQEEVLSAALVDLLARAVGQPPWSPPLPPWARAVHVEAAADLLLEALLDGGVDAAEQARPRAAAEAPERVERLLVPGSFHPFHEGHAGLASAAEERSGRRASFELSVHNVDKPPLPYSQVLARAAQTRAGRSLVLTREPTFLGKARLFPGARFAIGYDTAVRLVGPSYYGGTRDGAARALAELRHLGARFLVAGRLWQGVFRGLTDVDVPAGFAQLFEEIPEGAFRIDVSSTGLRTQQALTE